MKKMWAIFHSPSERFKSRCFPGNKLRSPGIFKEPMKNIWTVVIEFVEPLEEEYTYRGKVHFGMDEAPHELLYEDQEFDFMEGREVAIKIKVLQPVDEDE